MQQRLGEDCCGFLVFLSLVDDLARQNNALQSAVAQSWGVKQEEGLETSYPLQICFAEDGRERSRQWTFSELGIG